MVMSVLIVSPSVTWGRLRGLLRRPPCSARRPLHERADPRLLGGGQLLKREGGRPHDAFVEIRFVAEAERRVPRVELLGALEVADDLAVLVGVGGHPVPGLRREGGRAHLNDLVEPLGHGAVRLGHLGDLREHGAFPCRSVLVRTLFSLQLFGALPHRGPFLGREPLGLLRAHLSLLFRRFFRVLLRPARKDYSWLRALTTRFLIGLLTPFGHARGHPRRHACRLAPIDARRRTDQLAEAGAQGAQRQDNTRRVASIPAGDANRCWTGAIRTSENSVKRKSNFAEFTF